ncbi:MAG: hypothetical protein WC549_04565 [Actinomycetota bacterium]
MKIVFDINGCLDNSFRAMNFYKLFSTLEDWEIYIHSNCGINYVKNFIKETGLEAIPKTKDDKSIYYDIAVDDCENIENAKLTIIIK